MCIITFLLPIVVGIAINFISGASFSSIGENSFGIVTNELPQSTIEWLEKNGAVTGFETITELKAAINEPATQMIGVLQETSGIRTLLSGDELKSNTVIAATLPKLYEQRSTAADYTISVISKENENEGLKSLLVVITLVTAMFMGCTFNAMNIISEKEDGIEYINEILPTTWHGYIMQKAALGLIGGILSTVITAFVCIRLSTRQILPLIAVIILSAFIAALTGLFIGRFSSGLMTGIIYIKLAMILFIAPPILFYLTVPKGGVLHTCSYLIPSSAAFYALIDLVNGQNQEIGKNLGVLAVHCVVWTVLFLKLKRNTK